MSNVMTVTPANFDREVLGSKIPVLVDYWARWCMPCRVLEPVIEQIAGECVGSLKVGKVNVDEQPVLAELAGVQGLPFVALYRDGKLARHTMGAQDKASLLRALGLDASGAANTPTGSVSGC